MASWILSGSRRGTAESKALLTDSALVMMYDMKSKEEGDEDEELRLSSLVTTEEATIEEDDETKRFERSEMGLLRVMKEEEEDLDLGLVKIEEEER